jgi:putative transposase
MGRKPRMWHPGLVYHVTSRGNQKATIYKDDHDFEVFMHLLTLAKDKYPYQLYAYCLMSNHYHLLISSQDTPLSKIMARINKGYANYFNTRYTLTGHVFEKRYYSSPVHEGIGLLYVSRYIHQNPVMAKITVNPSDYPWSSCPQYVNDPNPFPSFPVDTKRVLTVYSGTESEKRACYRKYVEDIQDEVKRSAHID